MSWFPSTFSRSVQSSPKHDNWEEDQDDPGDTPSGSPLAGKGVTEEISELTKNITRQFWGVASFLAPPPSSQVNSPKHANTPQTETESPQIAEDTEDSQVAVDVDVLEGKETAGSPSVVGVSETDALNMAVGGSMWEAGNSSNSGSPSAGGNRLIGLRSDFAELRGTVATGFSRIQTVLRAVTQDDDEDEEEDAEEISPVVGSGFPQNPQEENAKDRRLSSLLRPLLGSMTSFRERLPSSERVESQPVSGEHGQGDLDSERQPKDKRTSSLASSIGGFSKLASSLIPFAQDIVGEFSGKDYYAVALTDEVVAFADNIAMHPETWLDFPLSEEEDDDDFEMTEAQGEHAQAVEHLASRLAAVHHELCPAIISDGRFWKIYFVLLHSRLSKDDAELLSTSQVLKTRELLLQHIRKKEPMISDTAPTQSEREELGLTDFSLADLPYKKVALEEHLESTAEFAPSPSMDEVSQDDTSLPKPESAHEGISGAEGTEEQTPQSGSGNFAALTLEDEDTDVNAWLDNDESDDIETAGVSGTLGTTHHRSADAGPAISIDDDVSFSDLEDDDNESNKGEDGAHTIKGGNKTGDPEIDSASAQALREGASSGSKPESDWLTVNQEDAASTGSSSP